MHPREYAARMSHVSVVAVAVVGVDEEKKWKTCKMAYRTHNNVRTIYTHIRIAIE